MVSIRTRPPGQHTPLPYARTIQLTDFSPSGYRRPVAGTATWGNWAGNQHAEGLEVVHPTDASELAAVVRSAAERGRRVKAVGSGHSFTGVARPDHVMVVLDRMVGVRRADPASGLVTVGAGTPLHVLNRDLARRDLALENLGDIEVQTVAGALSTGTHGTGARFGGLASRVAAVELVLADGSVVRCSPTERPDLFACARVGLGALGVVTEVTLQAVPLFLLQADEGPMALDEVLARFDELADTTDHFEAYWFPHTGNCLVKRNTRLPLDSGAAPLPRWREWFDDELLSNTVFGAVVAAGRRFPAVVPRANRLASRALGARRFTDLSYRVFTSPRRVRFCEMEYAVPRPAAVETVRRLVRAVERSGLRIAFPVELRVAAADDIPLSTASGRDSAYVAVHLPAGEDTTAYFALVARIMDDTDGRPHWGKMHDLDAATLATRYPCFGEFVDVRRQVDPAGVFANAYLDRVLGPATNPG